MLGPGLGEAVDQTPEFGEAEGDKVGGSVSAFSVSSSRARLMSGPWYLEWRVPRIAPGDVRIDVAAAAFEIVPGSGFACLPDAPAARTPGVRVVAHEEALRA